MDYKKDNISYLIVLIFVLIILILIPVYIYEYFYINKNNNNTIIANIIYFLKISSQIIILIIFAISFLIFVFI